MLLHVCMLPQWAIEEGLGLPKAIQGQFTFDQLIDYNCQGYNIYFYPNGPSQITYDTLPNFPNSNTKRFIVSGDVDTFDWIFLDLDMKHNAYASKAEFIEILMTFDLIPTKVVDSGNGIHAYWKVSDKIDAMTYLRLSRRLCRKFNTDEAVTKIKQLMRVPNTANTKIKGDYRLCELLFEAEENQYTAEQFDKFLPKITPTDEEFCVKHYNTSYGIEDKNTSVDDTIPPKFAELIRNSREAKELWISDTGDRSKADYRLGHLMLAHGFTADEAKSVLINSRKALERGPTHRIAYATNIVDKIFTSGDTPKSANEPKENKIPLSRSVSDILSQDPNKTLRGTRFSCHRIVDATSGGFRLTQVLGLIGGSGVGKTAFALNIFKWCVQNNSQYVHFFISLEQPEEEIAARWAKMAAKDPQLNDMVHILGNYNEDGSYRDLSLNDVKDYLLEFEKTTGQKVGCVCLDHIGIVRHDTKNGENEGLMGVFKQLKSFAQATNTFFIVQSQTSREKAGIGDLELNKDAAYGSGLFENHCDFVVTLWQPLKRVISECKHLSVTAYKFCKIRKKNIDTDDIQEDKRYRVIFDPNTESFRELTEKEEQSFDFYNKKATNLRKQDRKTDVLEYSSTSWVKEPVAVEVTKS